MGPGGKRNDRVESLFVHRMAVIEATTTERKTMDSIVARRTGEGQASHGSYMHLRLSMYIGWLPGAPVENSNRSGARCMGGDTQERPIISDEIHSSLGID